MANSTQNQVKILGGRSVVQFAPINQTSGSTLLPPFDPQNAEHLRTEVEEPINGWKTYIHTFQAKDQNYVDSLLQPFLSQASPPLLSMRFGLIAGQNANWRAWEDQILISHSVLVRPDLKSGPLVTIRTVDRLWLMHTVKKARAHRGTMSAIVQKFWKEVGGDQALVEDTVLLGHTNNTGVWYQGFESDWSFLMRTVLPQSRNATGLGGYRIFIRDNVLRFHSPTFGASQPKQLLYTTGAPGFDDLKVTSHFFEMAGGSGAAGFRRAVYDPLTGEARMLQSDPDKLLKLAGSRPVYNNWEYRLSHVGSNLVSSEDARNQQMFAVLNSESFSSEFSSDKCMDIRVGDVLEVFLAPSLTASSLYSGQWLVNKAVHTLNQGSMSSRYVIVRGEFNLAAQKTAIDPNSFESSNSAPGVGFNPASQQNITSTQQTPNTNVNTGDGVSMPILSPS